MLLQLYPNAEQETKMMKTFGCRRFIYNLFLDQRSKGWKRRKESISFKQQKDMLPELKKRIPFLAEVDAMGLQETVKDLDDAYQNFFEGKAKYPRFKRKRDEQSYTTNQTNNNIRFTNDRFTLIQLPKLGEVKCEGSFVRLRRLLKNKGAVIKAATIRRKGGKYFVSLRVQKEAKPAKVPVAKRRAIGIDVGIKTFAVLSDGNPVPNPHYFSEAQQQLRKQQKRLSRMIKGSNNYIKQKKKVAKIHAKIANQRKDFQHKKSKKLTDENQILCIEDLNVRGMVKNRKLAKHIADAAWYQFRNFLTYKAERKGRTLVIVDRFYASSKICSHCDKKKEGLTLDERTWVCLSCGKKHGRDENAALNLEKEGLRILGA